MTNDERIEHMLLAAVGTYVTIEDMMQATRADRHSVINAVSRLRHRYGPRLVGKRAGRGYAIVGPRVKRVKLPMPKLCIPADLWRGWCNPLTGICGARLGLD